MSNAMPEGARHPGLQAILNKLHRGVAVSDAELCQLQRQIADLEHRARSHRRDAAGSERVPGPETVGPTLPGHATCEAVERRVADPDRDVAAMRYTLVQGTLISRIGIGTYRGAADDRTDAAYTETIHAALRAGINVIDTSLSYRSQRSERAVGAGLRRFLEDSDGRRDEVLVCTKGGYLVPEAITPGTLAPGDVVDGDHAIAPAFLADQIERSRRNLGLDTIDVYYLHNPEVQLKTMARRAFMDRIRAAFDRLERAVSEGVIRYYGTSTWSGYRDGSLSLPELAAVAHQLAGDHHHFRFVQLPCNLGMQEALACRVSGGRTVLDLARELGITVIASASLLQGRLAQDLPREIVPMLPGMASDAQRALQFTRSTPGIAVALVGMTSTAHLAENLAVTRAPPLTPAEHRRLRAALSRAISPPA
jgi:aryl-alcohol dehydrogenase-like predicted oxidoreductase